MTEEIKRLWDDFIPQDAFFMFAVCWVSFWCAVGLFEGFSTLVENFIRDGFIAIIARWPMPKEVKHE